MAVTELAPTVDFETDPSRYRHWRLAIDPPIATLTLDVNEDAGLVPGYVLKLNSYDLGVRLPPRAASARRLARHGRTHAHARQAPRAARHRRRVLDTR